MNILRIANIANNRTGGMSRTMYLTGDELVRRGHQVRYLFHDDIVKGASSKLDRFKVPLRMPRLVRQIQETEKVDLVEIHEASASAYTYQRRHGATLPPVVIFSYGLEERGYLADLDYRRLKGIPIPLKFRVSPYSQILQSKYTVRHADHVICSNQDDVDYLAGKSVPRERLTCHHSGVTEAFLQKTAGLADANQRGVLLLGSWLTRKGVMDVVPAVTELLRTNPEASFTAAGIGVPESVVYEQFAPDIRSRVKVVRSMTSDEELVEVLRQNHIFLLPSYFEGQPLAMIEAAAGGLAIITTNICGMKDFVTDHVNGRLLPVGDTKSITQTLLQLWSDPAMCKSMGQAARRTAETHTWAAAGQNIEAAYEKTLAQSA